jgi:uncharacterized protein
VNSNPVGWFEIYVEDMKRARAFYEAVLATELNNLQGPVGIELEMWAFPMDQNKVGASGALVKMTGMHVGANSTIVYFSCDDCAVEESRVKNAGGRVQRPKTPIGAYGHIALALDTEGNIFGLHSRS